MTVTPTNSDIVKLYDVDGYGVVGRGSGVFVKLCIDKFEVDFLEVGESCFARFHSYGGIKDLKVLRVS